MTGSALFVLLVILCFSLEANSLDWVSTVHESPSSDVTVSDQWQDSSELPVMKADIQLKNKKCSCEGTGCQCCMDVKLTLITLKVCAGFALNQQEKALEFTVKIDDHVIFRKKISDSLPTKFCHEFTIHGISANVCVSLKNISFKKGHIGACIYLSVDASVFHWNKKLGCIFKKRAFTRNVQAIYGKFARPIALR